MKRKNSFVLPLLLLLFVSTACHFHHRHLRTVSVKSPDYSLNIEYCGDIIFNDDETAIEGISPEGYIKYRKNDMRFTAKGNYDGDISYKLMDGDRRLNYCDEDARDFMASAIREIVFHYHH